MRGATLGSRTVELVLEEVKNPPANSNVSAFPIDLDIVCAQAHEDAYEEAFDGLIPNPAWAMLSRLAPTLPELRFRPPGLARTKELKAAFSNVLGRAFARGFLYEHSDITWFAPVERLLKAPMRGYTAVRPAAGDMPDWLAASDTRAEVVEAKGVHKKTIHRRAAILNRWRKQLQNIEVRKNGRARSLKGWIIATRWVTTDEILTPRMYVEDPRTPGDVEPTPEEMHDLVEWSAREHIADYLFKIGEIGLGLRTQGGDVGPRANTIWRVDRDEAQNPFQGLEFVGRMRPAYPWETRGWIGPNPSYWTERRIFSWPGLVFEGIDLATVKDALHAKVPDTNRIRQREGVPHGTLLRDGTIVLPADVMTANREQVVE